MSAMKTFTVRELDRAPSRVLEACDRDGEARIRRRDGKTYLLRPEQEPARAISALSDFAARRRRLFPKSLTRRQARQVDNLLRGE